MASERPIARHFIACRGLTLAEDGKDVSLNNLVANINRLPGESFPVLQELALYALLSNGRGEHDFAIDLTIWERGEGGTEAFERTLKRSPPRRIDLGQGPTAVFGLPFPRVKVQFDRAGQYTFYLLCDNERIAEEHVEVR